MIKHNIKPIFNVDSKVLILGTFPSPKSRAVCMYYANPYNRMWKVLAKIFNESFPLDKKHFLLNHHIAMWDVLQSCDIIGASDLTIKHEKPNNLDDILNKADIKLIITAGNKAYSLYKKYFNYEIELMCLPSTSPANARYSFDDLVNKYKIILEYIDD